MTIEDKLKKHILSRYNSLREFTIEYDIPYSTLSGVLNRGINNSSVGTIIKICKALNISADGLADGEIIPIVKKSVNRSDLIEVNDILTDTKTKLIYTDDLTLNGNPIDKHSIEPILDAMDVGLEIVKRKKS